MQLYGFKGAQGGYIIATFFGLLTTFVSLIRLQSMDSTLEYAMTAEQRHLHRTQYPSIITGMAINLTLAVFGIGALVINFFLREAFPVWIEIGATLVFLVAETCALCFTVITWSPLICEPKGIYGPFQEAVDQSSSCNAWYFSVVALSLTVTVLFAHLLLLTILLTRYRKSHPRFLFEPVPGPFTWTLPPPPSETTSTKSRSAPLTDVSLANYVTTLPVTTTRGTVEHRGEHDPFKSLI